jgi:hypothetical protein
MRYLGLESPISCGLARPRSLAGEKPTQVTVSYGPGISLAGVLVTGHLMIRQERKRGAMGTGDADLEGVEPR